MLRVFALGAPAIGGQKLTYRLLRQPKHLAFLVYMAVEARGPGVQRDHLLALFWPELDDRRAQHALRQMSYHLRQDLGRDVLRSHGSSRLAVDPEAVWCDAAELLRAEDDPQRVCELYRGEFLDAVHPPGVSLALMDWLDATRYDLRGRAASAAWSLSERAERTGAERDTERWAVAASRLAPFDEMGMRKLMRAFVRLGENARAIREYVAFEQRLANEFEMQPSPATRALAQAIREGRVGLGQPGASAEIVG